jgi:hypothetical protein
MIIQLGLYKRAPGISKAEYIRLWTEVYGALNGKIPELSRHLHRYVQHVLTPAPGTPPELAFDGMSETWFVSEEAMRALPNEPAFKERIAPFTKLFIDFEATRLSFSDAPVYQIGGPPPLVGASTDCPC